MPDSSEPRLGQLSRAGSARSPRRSSRRRTRASTTESRARGSTSPASAHSPLPLNTFDQHVGQRQRLQHVVEAHAARGHLAFGQRLDPHVAHGSDRAERADDHGQSGVDAPRRCAPDCAGRRPGRRRRSRSRRARCSEHSGHGSRPSPYCSHSAQPISAGADERSPAGTRAAAAAAGSAPSEVTPIVITSIR